MTPSFLPGLITALAAVTIFWTPLLEAQPILSLPFPTKPIKLVVPYPPGGATDVIGRVLAPRLATELAEQIVLENRVGAAGSVAAGAVANGPADGHTLLMGALTSHAIYGAMFDRTVPFDIEQSFVPISIVATVPFVFVVHPDVKAGTLAGLIALAKANPDGLSYGSAGKGSPQHLAGEIFQRKAGIQMRHVPYDGSGPAVAQLVMGRVQVMIDSVTAVQQHVLAGRLRALATATADPIGTLPGVPTAAQAGLDGFELSSVFGVLGPAGTPDATVAKISNALRVVMEMPEVGKKLLDLGAKATWTSVAEAETAVRDENAKWRKVIKDNDIKAE